MIILEANRVSLTRGHRVLVDDVSARFPAGGITVVVGPNGAGKSTLIRLLCGELDPSSGQIGILGQDIRSLPAWRLACMRAVMPQASEMAFPFSVQEVVQLGVSGIGRGINLKHRTQIINQSIENADITHLKNRVYSTLSGGEKQRVHFARVLAQLAAGSTVERQQILFLDEPISSLDLKHQLLLLEQVKRLADQGLTVVAVLHDLQLAAAVATHIVMMDSGRIVATGKPETVLTAGHINAVFEISLNGPVLPPCPWHGRVSSMPAAATIPPSTRT